MSKQVFHGGTFQGCQFGNKQQNRLLFEIDGELLEVSVEDKFLKKVARTLAQAGAVNMNIVTSEGEMKSPFDFPDRAAKENV